jgi:rRNA maturation protein Nop10
VSGHRTSATVEQATLLAVFCPECGQKLCLVKPTRFSWNPEVPASKEERRDCRSCHAMWHIIVREVPAPAGVDPLWAADFFPIDPITLLPIF